MKRQINGVINPLHNVLIFMLSPRIPVIGCLNTPSDLQVAPPCARHTAWNLKRCGWWSSCSAITTTLKSLFFTVNIPPDHHKTAIDP